MAGYSIPRLLLVLVCIVTYALPYPTPANAFDVIVIGGGPAGLSATSGLARVRRNVLMLDSGEYRNAATRHMHDVIGNDGTVPATFRALARQQIMRYPTAYMTNATVTEISGNSTAGFRVRTSEDRYFQSHKVVIATGMQDVMPSTPGIAENWGKGIFWCPWCDGYEHRDQPFGIIGPYADVLSTVFEVATLESDIVAFVNGTHTPEAISQVSSNPPDGYNSWQKKLEKFNIVIDNRTMESITRLQDGAVAQSAEAMSEYDRFLVTFTDGGTVERNAFIANFPAIQRSNLGASMGIPLDDKHHLKTNFQMESIVPGVFVVGDANADNSTNVPHAMWSGKRAAVQIHIALEQEHSDAMITGRSLRLMEDEVSSLMGRDVRDIYDYLMST